MLMINKRLIREVDSSMKYVGLSVLCRVLNSFDFLIYPSRSHKA